MTDRLTDHLNRALDACYQYAACADRAAEAAVVTLADALAWWYHVTDGGRDDAEAVDGVLAALDAVRAHDADHPAALATRYAVAGIREAYARVAYDDARASHRRGYHGDAMVQAEAAIAHAEGARRDALGHVARINAEALINAGRMARDTAARAYDDAAYDAALARRRAEAMA